MTAFFGIKSTLYAVMSYDLPSLQEWVMTCDQQILDDAFHKAMISNPIIQDMRSHLVTIDTRVGVLKSDVAELKSDVAELKIGQHEMGLKMDEIRNNIQIILDILIPTLEVAPRASAHLTWANPGNPGSLALVSQKSLHAKCAFLIIFSVLS
jgi:hypothetical protein